MPDPDPRPTRLSLDRNPAESAERMPSIAHEGPFDPTPRVSEPYQSSQHPSKKPLASPGAEWAKVPVVTGRRRGDSNPQG